MLKIDRLSREHNRADFDCGKEPLNRFLRESARQHAERELSRTFVLIDDSDPSTILGYFTMTVCEVMPEDIPDPRLHRYPHPMPAVKLARLAVAGAQQRCGYGGLLLSEAMKRTLSIADSAGLIGMIVDAKDQDAKEFYQAFDFVDTENNPFQLFLPIATIHQAFQ